VMDVDICTHRPLRAKLALMGNESASEQKLLVHGRPAA